MLNFFKSEEQKAFEQKQFEDFQAEEARRIRREEKQAEISAGLARIQELEEKLTEGAARRAAIKAELQGYQTEYDELRLQFKNQVKNAAI